MILSKSIIFSALLVLCMTAHAGLEVCGPISENDDGDLTVTSQSDGRIYVIGANENRDDTPEVEEMNGDPVCFAGELEEVSSVEDPSETPRTIASEAPAEFQTLNVENVWIPVTEESVYTGGGGGRKGTASFPCPDFL